MATNLSIDPDLLERGLQVGTTSALIARPCLRYDLELLTTDKDFARLSRIAPLRLSCSS